MANKNYFPPLIIIICFSFFAPILSEPPTRVIIGTQNQTININTDCNQIEILTNYKHVQLRMKNLKNIEKVLITDKLITSCNFKECAGDANICQSIEYNLTFNSYL
jgi:hypothetical protein